MELIIKLWLSGVVILASLVMVRIALGRFAHAIWDRVIERVHICMIVATAIIVIAYMWSLL